MIWTVTICVWAILAAEPGLTQKLTTQGFSCEGRGTGYYADVTTGCQVYHMCDGLGRQFSYTCPNATLFQQRMLICDHWYMVNCSKSEADYSANSLIGSRKPFVEDSVANPYSRTPRPDLLSAPSNASEFNVIYRSGHNQNFTPKNIVGAESDDSDSTDEPTYFPPSHWSTELPARSSDTPSVRRPQYHEIKQPNNVYRTSYDSSRRNKDHSSIRPNEGMAVQVDSANRNGNSFSDSTPSGGRVSVPVGFKSNFKATTPVYPTSVEDTTSSPNNIGLLPPLPYANSKLDTSKENKPPLDLLPPYVSEGGTQSEVRPSDYSSDAENKVNFPSNFKATTPVYPSKDELTRELEGKLPATRIHVHFQSDFKATTPVYPNYVDPTSPNPAQLGILPPKKNNVNFPSTFEATTPQYPTSVDPTSPNPSDLGFLPPEEGTENSNEYYESNFKATTPQYPTFVDNTSPNPSEVGLLPPKRNNFESNFKATTPQYPQHVDPSLGVFDGGLLPPKETNLVNFESNFKATTPQYPNHVEATSQDPSLVGLLPPQPPNLAGLITENSDSEDPFSSLPSKFYEASNYDGDFTDEGELQEQPGIRMSNFMKSFSQSQWQDLRKTFRIPEYEFPLENPQRPGYDSIVNSFDPKAAKKR